MFLKSKNIKENKKKSSLKYNNKWDNMSFEHGLENKRKNFDEKMKELKQEIKFLYNNLSNFKKDKEDMEYSRDILENYAKYNHEEEKLMKKMSLVAKRMDKLTEIEFEKISQFKKMLDVNKQAFLYI